MNALKVTLRRLSRVTVIHSAEFMTFALTPLYSRACHATVIRSVQFMATVVQTAKWNLKCEVLLTFQSAEQLEISELHTTVSSVSGQCHLMLSHK